MHYLTFSCSVCATCVPRNSDRQLLLDIHCPPCITLLLAVARSPRALNMPSFQFRSRLLFASLALALVLLLEWPTSTSSWILLACWPLGVLLFSYLARVYLAPYVLMRCSSHIRVRSVSLRSIRGLYFRKGSRTWRIDRFVYSYRSSADNGPRRLSFRIEGFTLEIQPSPAPRPPPPRATHRRGLTLADLSPSPLALYLWSVISGLHVVFEPAVRPVIRLIVTAALQQVIRFIPRLMETVQVDIDRAVVSYVGSPQVQLIVQNVTFKGHVSFAQSPQFHPIGDYVPSSNYTLSARALAMGAWKSRLSNGFQRAWTRTWNDTLGRMTGSISYDFVVRQFHAFIPSEGLVQMGMLSRGFVQVILTRYFRHIPQWDNTALTRVVSCQWFGPL